MNPFVEIVPSELVSDERAALLKAINRREFGSDRLTYATSQWYVMGMLAGELIGRVGVLERDISVGGTTLKIGGVTGVVTEPSYRRRGVARRLIAEAVAFLRYDRQLPFALLTCNRKLGPLYEKLGWRAVPGPTTYVQPEGSRTCTGLTMVFESGGSSWPDGPIDMRGLPW